MLYISFPVNEAPDGTIGIFDKDDVQNVQCDARSIQYVCTNHTYADARNVHLLSKNKSTNKLTTTKVSQSVFFNE